MSARDILDRQLAEGSIDVKEYERLRRLVDDADIRNSRIPSEAAFQPPCSARQ
jgi:hypothetical protein